MQQDLTSYPHDPLFSPAYHIFGDESIRGENIFYGLVCVPINRLQLVENILGDVKIAFGGDSSSRFHCRELFHKDARRKSAWRRLSDKNALKLALSVTSRLAGLGIRTSVGHVKRPPIGEVIEGVGSIGGMTVKDSKQFIPFAYHVAVLPFMLDPEFSGRCKLWIEPSGDFINWFGGQKKALERLMKFNLLDENTGDVLRHFAPENVASKERPNLIDLADLLAYSSCRSICDVQGKNRHSDRVVYEIYKSMSPNVGTMNLVPSAR